MYLVLALARKSLGVHWRKYSTFFCCILSLYRVSFDASIGLDEASCAGHEVSSGVSPRAE